MRGRGSQPLIAEPERLFPGRPNRKRSGERGLLESRRAHGDLVWSGRIIKRGSREPGCFPFDFPNQIDEYKPRIYVYVMIKRIAFAERLVLVQLYSSQYLRFWERMEWIKSSFGLKGRDRP
ncbi:hypothetical protein TorRG33x02_318020 [Trema orientale]|uniref:Uncharacterized protein n=1 Tax=Trema orientale TaxID=63057 RepID=A0A2P5BKJ4_TREOI|nr:hypothetical protein TorRG33x02_318020 [Trema orientale]